jgi:hypothetical protein
MAHSLQNQMLLPTTLMSFEMTRLAKLGMTYQQQMLTTHPSIFYQIMKTIIVIWNSVM